MADTLDTLKLGWRDLYVLPGSLNDDAIHSCSTDAVMPSECRDVSLTGSKRFTDGSDYCWGELSGVMMFTVNDATLTRRVLHVVGQGSEKQMRWINTGRIVAFMKNEQPGGNASVV